VWFVFRASARRSIASLVVLALVPATVLVWFITGGFTGAHMLGWKAGWMWDDETFLEWCQSHFGQTTLSAYRQHPRIAAGLLFWPLNFGLLPVTVLLLVSVLCRRGADSRARLLVFPSLGIFVVCCFAKFAVWEWDNTKLMIWSYLAILPFLWSELLAGAAAWQRWFIVFMLFFSGFVSTLGGIAAAFTGYPIAQRSELDAVADVLRGIPVTERFAGAPTYNHPLLLDGRKMVLGYPGHVRSHGLAWQEPLVKLDALLDGEDGWREIAATLGARYLFWGREENENHNDSPQPWRQTTRVVASGEWGAIYDLYSPPAIPRGPTPPQE
jgi:hypothetical protein